MVEKTSQSNYNNGFSTFIFTIEHSYYFRILLHSKKQT